MSGTNQVRINVDAANALAHWKRRFAAEVLEQAKRLAARSDRPHRVTLPHFRQAAPLALQTLEQAILAEEGSDGRQEAA